MLPNRHHIDIRDWAPLGGQELIGTYALVALVGLVVAELAFGVLERVADLVGHESTLMGRMELWRQCLAVDTQPNLWSRF